MKNNQFKKYAANPSNLQWLELIKREKELYERADDSRSPFMRDYTRILHSFAYRRLKHKTQVFFNIDNDHICTRMEHVAHVESVSNTIAKRLGLNEELTRAIAIGHDLGHAPFGHQGETVLSDIVKKYLDPKESFWHEKNGLRFVDKVELLEDKNKQYQNLSLTYAVRDGIVSHCGEVNENGLIPRSEFIDLSEFDKPGKYQPVTWEGCVVKISDKIAYLGRDVEDAISLGFLNVKTKEELLQVARSSDQNVINTTTIIYTLITDICENSSPEKGIALSSKCLKLLDMAKDFNDKHIYKHKRFKAYKDYSKLVIEEIFRCLYECFPDRPSVKTLWDNLDEIKKYYPIFISTFETHLSKYCNGEMIPDRLEELKILSINCKNDKIYNNIDTKAIYVQAIIDYISGMTDRFAVRVFDELIRFEQYK